MNTFDPITAQVHRVRRGSLLVGASALAACSIGAAVDLEQFFHSWLLASLFWWSVVLGCLALLMLHHLVGGRWGFVTRRLLEAGVRAIPLVTLLFTPVIAGLVFRWHHLYAWAQEGATTHNEALAHKSPYLNTTFFVARAIVYFAIWWLLGHLLIRRASRTEQSREPSTDLSNASLPRLQRLSGPGLVLYGVTVTFAAIDWGMSLEPLWFSSAYGVLFIAGQALGAICFVIVGLALLSRSAALAAVLERGHFHDLGNLLLAFLLIWSYVSFSQYLIIWSGNLTEEIPWYRDRTAGGWQALAATLIVLHFVVPLLVLLWRRAKRNPVSLAALAGGLLALRLVDVFWLVAPAFHPSTLAVHWMDVAAPFGIGGLLCAFLLRELEKRSLVPLGDPRFQEDRI